MRRNPLIILLAVAALSLGCDEDSGTDAGPGGGTDAGPGGTDAGPPGDMDAGPGDDDAGPGDVDAGAAGDFTFRTETPDMYTRVDRAGAPAVSTALVSSAMKNAYNDDDPSDDVTGDAPGKWAGEFIASLDALHAAVGMTSGLTLDEQLTGAGLTPCSSGADCATQEIAAGVPVYSFIIPDVITLNTNMPAGFPNGRQLSDPVMDVVLALVLLDLDGTHSVGTLGGLPLNPTANDVPFEATFPYVADPHTP